MSSPSKSKNICTDLINNPNLPSNYVCFRCGQRGHHIRKCPTHSHAIKRSTGIPNSFMVPVDGPDHKGALLTSSGRYAVPFVQYLSYKEQKKEEPPVVPPQDIQPIKSITKDSRNGDKQDQFPAWPIPSFQGSKRSPVSGRFQNSLKTETEALTQQKESDVPPHEEISVPGHQEYDVMHHIKAHLAQQQANNITHQHGTIPVLTHQYNMPLQVNGPLVGPQENEVALHQEQALLQPQELYQQFHMPPPGEVLLYQEYNVSPYGKDYYLQQQEQYQPTPYQLSMPATISSQPVHSQPQYTFPDTQMFSLQSQPAGEFSINDSQQSLPSGDEPQLTKTEDSVFKSTFQEVPFEQEDASTNQEEEDGSTLLEQLQKKLDKLYKKYAKGKGKRTRTRSTEDHESGSVSQSSSSKLWNRAGSKSPDGTSHSKSPQQDRSRLYSRSRSESRERSYSRSRYRTGTRSRSHSRSRSESEERHQNIYKRKIISLDPDQQSRYSGFRSRSGSREHSYPRSRYHTGTRSRSHSRSRNESEDRHQNTSKVKTNSLDPDQQSSYPGFRSRSGSRERSYSRSRYRTGTRSRSHSRSRNESEDIQPSVSSKNHNIYSGQRGRYSKSSLGSIEDSYPMSSYGTIPRSHSKFRNESGDRHQSSSSEKIHHLNPNQQYKYSHSWPTPMFKKQFYYSKPGYPTGPTYHQSRERNELRDRYQGSSTEKLRYLDRAEQEKSRLYSGSRSGPRDQYYSKSSYQEDRQSSSSHSSQRYEEGDEHQSSSPNFKTHTKAELFRASYPGRTYVSKHNKPYPHK